MTTDTAQTPAPKPTFSLLLKMDLRARGLTQEDLPALLAEGEVAPITSSAISMWKHRRPPQKWVVKLVQLFGPDSHLARAVDSGDMLDPIPPFISKDLYHALNPVNRAAPALPQQVAALPLMAACPTGPAAAPTAPTAPRVSDQALQIAALYDLLPADMITRAKVYAEVTAAIVQELQRRQST